MQCVVRSGVPTGHRAGQQADERVQAGHVIDLPTSQAGHRCYPSALRHLVLVVALPWVRGISASLVRESCEIVVLWGHLEVARTRAAWAVRETAHPPTFYLPLADVRPGLLQPAGDGSFCEWKGPARGEQARTIRAIACLFACVPRQPVRHDGRWFQPGPVQHDAMIYQDPIETQLAEAELMKARKNPTGLELSASWVRAVSPIHLKYFHHMGVAATAVVSLIVNGRLWGMPVRHHNTPPGVSAGQRAVPDIVGQRR